MSAVKGNACGKSRRQNADADLRLEIMYSKNCSQDSILEIYLIKILILIDNIKI